MKSIDLAEAGIHVYRCQLWLDDYLWFASSDISAVSTTENVIHNYALAYALNRYDRAFVTQTAPTYDEDLAEMDIYPSPATAPRAKRTSLTFNAIDTATYQTESPELGKRLTPKIGVRRVLNPTISEERAFRFYAFVRDGSHLPRVIRLGKKRSPAHLVAHQVSASKCHLNEDEVEISHVVNPLDSRGKPVTYSVVSIPPHLLLENATLRGVWSLRDEMRQVLVPNRVIDWVNGGTDNAH
jgi:CRISPR-associated protein Csc1